MLKLVLLRHGQSIWNLENKFTGWTDVTLSEQGIDEAHQAGELLRGEGYAFDLAFTSVLKRAIYTLWIVLDEMDLMWIPVHCSWRLNERHYGAFQGLNKKGAAAKYGLGQIQIWRRSYDITPPPLVATDNRYPGYDSRYSNLKKEELPCTESLKDTQSRILPYWNKVIVPNIMKGKRIIITAHGNSIRALVKHLDGISNEAIAKYNIPTGIPLVYEFDQNLKVKTHFYLGDEKAVQERNVSAGNHAHKKYQKVGRRRHQ